MKDNSFPGITSIPLVRPETAGILHLGLGNFHRAHLALYTAAAVSDQAGDWGIIGVATSSHRVVDPLRSQDNKYSIITLDPDGPRAEVINIHTRVLVAAEELEEVLEAMAEESVKIISLTVTEEGYSFSQRLGGLDTDSSSIKHDLKANVLPKTVIGQLAEGLSRRFKRSGAGVTILSCDNLVGNGGLTRGVIREFIMKKNAPDSAALLEWIATSVTFPATMVDRIVPSTETRHLEIAKGLTGFPDQAPVPAEPFTMWVMEDNFAAGRPKWEAYGAIFAADLLPYELLKLRILNASNSLFAYLGLLADLPLIAQAAGRPDFYSAVESLMREDMLPSFSPPEEIEINQYISETLARFQNLDVGHRTIQVGSDGSNKLAIRITDPVLYHHARGNVPKFLALLAAAYIEVFTNPDSYDHESTGRPTDPQSVKLLEIGQRGLTSTALARVVLTESGIFPPTLAQAGPWISMVSDLHAKLVSEGIDSVVQGVLID